MEKFPLVSICVITYNSSKYILETLDSAKAQTYQNIELIISDDCSKDNTVEICKNWINDNKERFARTELITVKKNTGISQNCNRVRDAARGEWIKGIAGDDILFPNAIHSFVSFVEKKKSEDIVWVVSSIKIFKDHPDNLLYIWPNFNISENIREQFRRQIMGNYIKAPGVFLKRETLNRLGGPNLDYPMLEDDPLWIKFLTNGYKFYFIDEVLVGYRVHSNAISTGNHAFKKQFFQSLYDFKKEITFPYMKKESMYLSYIIHKMEFYAAYRIVFAGKKRIRDKLQLKIANYLKYLVKDYNKGYLER